jgi:hypothetical protein
MIAMKSTVHRDPKPLTDEEMLRIIDKAWGRFHGDTTVLASAIGTLVFGRKVGWQALRLIYSRATFNKYEGLLGIKFREILPKRGPDANSILGIRMADKIGEFWQAVSSGLVPAREAAQTA